MRQKRINTAVKFLQNPKVRETPVSARKAFLEKKGLSKDEIEEALRVSGTASDEISRPSNFPAPPQRGIRTPSSGHASRLPLPPVPWRSYVGAAILGGGIGYTLAHLFKTFVLPYFYHTKSKEEEKLEKIETTVTELKGNMEERVQKSLESVEGLLEQQQTKLQSLALDLASTQSKVALLPSESYTVGDLKGEILSLKGLLLNRKQFPSPLVGSTPGAPSIPAWQRAVTSTERTRTTSSLADSSEMPVTTESSDSKELSKVSSFEHSAMNGELSKHLDNVEKEASTEMQDIVTLENSPANQSGTSSSGTESTATPKTVVAVDEKSLNDAMLNDTSVISSDGSLSSMSDLSGNTSFHDTSIAFSSTCIKAPSDIGLRSDSTGESEEGVSDSIGVVTVQ